jgi:hypothetical protein
MIIAKAPLIPNHSFLLMIVYMGLIKYGSEGILNQRGFAIVMILPSLLKKVHYLTGGQTLLVGNIEN